MLLYFSYYSDSFSWCLPMFVLVLQGAYSNTMATWISSCGDLRFFTLYFWDKLHFHVLCHFFESLLCSQIHGPWSLKGLSDLLVLVHRLWYWPTSLWNCVEKLFLKYCFDLSTLGADIIPLPLSHGQWHSSSHHRWELLGNYPVFTVVMVIYHYVERTWRILVTPDFLYNTYDHEKTLSRWTS